MRKFALADADADLNADFSTQKSAFADADAKFRELNLSSPVFGLVNCL